MHVIAGVLVVASLFGFGIYKAFIDPTYVVNVGESMSWTEACVDGDDALAIHEEGTEGVREETSAAALAISHLDGPGAVVLFFGSEEDARISQERLRELADDDRAERIDQRSSLVFVHLDQADDEAEAMFGRCLVEVSDNKWGAWTGFETQTIGRPFADT